ncbi:flagellar FliJ family protein [Temperatibacter marinus]|uniref:Flagellar FliJ family protein n=1 Tax=Temperatibacter marinus TaxID=1456591 RepID=A0AA52EHS2_9PROT|nr:flagellar FliJ family protein [Temperatibacter marinus]WND02749.1 flagellar FliJ family protein [Temperatibacter marinus]
MAQLDSIIRFQKWELDNKRRDLAAVEQERDLIIDQLNALIAELEQESHNYNQEINDFSVLQMGAFADGIRYKRETLEIELNLKNEEVETHKEIVTEAFQVLKTYEVAQENRSKAEQKELARQETMILDEQGLQSFVRKQDS